MKEWTQAWLAYEKRQDQGNKKFAEKVLLSGFSETHPVILNALAEWKRGIGGMPGADVEVKEEESPAEQDTVADVVSGRTMGNKNAGIAAVCNTGNDANWTGSDLAAADFYGFGRLAYSTGLSAEEIAEEWIRLTFSNDGEVVEKVKKILLSSREVYEKYTCPEELQLYNAREWRDQVNSCFYRKCGIADEKGRKIY